MPFELVGRRVLLRPTRAEDVSELRRIRFLPEVAAWWGEVAEAGDWPFDDPETDVFTVIEGGAIRGLIQYGEEQTPGYRHASIDIFLDPPAHGRGLGRDAVYTLAHHLISVRGHHRLVIDPAADNVAAVRCYSSVGFRPVGLMRRYERDADGGGWHDGLLMDLLAEELERPDG